MELKTKISSLKLKNPLILASGIMDETAGSIKKIYESGASAAVTKSIGIKPRKGYPNPTFVELKHGILNCMGLPSPGIEEYKEEMEKLSKYNIPTIASIYGANSDEFVILAEKMEEYGAYAIELNLSCPHAKSYGLELGSKPEIVKKIIREIKQNIDIPIFAKLSPNLTDIKNISRHAEKAGADAIVAINTVKAMKIDINLKTPVLSNKIGGYSGEAIKPIGIRNVYEIYKTVDIPVIGVGGITKGEDVIEYLMAGANAVQIGTAIYQRELNVFKKINDEIKRWMKKNNVQKISELIGVAHK
ncbi:MAG: dihydroorotate dehydrogenase [Candidatus Thermoplasmatota archaeon]